MCSYGRENWIPISSFLVNPTSMKKLSLLLLASGISLFSSCAPNTPGGQAEHAVNRAGHLAHSINSIQSLF